MMRVILASKSPRRREILGFLGVPFEVITADTDESSDISDARLLVQELARRKGEAVRELLRARGEWNDDTLVIAADTVVAANGKILGKPRDEKDAARMLTMLSDTAHEVISGVALFRGERVTTAAECTTVSFGKMSEKNIEWYVKSGEPRDKAGAYAIQGLASLFIKGLSGDYFNVVGLPVYRLNQLLLDFTGKSLADLSL